MSWTTRGGTGPQSLPQLPVEEHAHPLLGLRVRRGVLENDPDRGPLPGTLLRLWRRQAHHAPGRLISCAWAFTSGGRESSAISFHAPQFGQRTE